MKREISLGPLASSLLKINVKWTEIPKVGNMIMIEITAVNQSRASDWS